MRIIRGSSYVCPLCLLDWDHRECITVQIPEAER